MKEILSDFTAVNEGDLRMLLLLAASAKGQVLLKTNKHKTWKGNPNSSFQLQQKQLFKVAGSQQNDLKERLRRKLTILKEERDDKEGLRTF